MQRIFLTVGTNTPFDRLVTAVDEWCGNKKDVTVFGQIGPTEYVPKNLKYQKFLSPSDFKRELELCDLIVSHAGMGTILSALKYNKPIIVMPRKLIMHETRNDHQISTCKHFSSIETIKIAWTEKDLPEVINNSKKITHKCPTEINISKKLINTIQEIIFSIGSNCKVMCIASGGGHWIQLSRLMNRLKRCELIQVTTELGEEQPTTLKSSFYEVPNATRWSKLGLVKTATKISLLILRKKPNVIISTGAAPGFFAILVGKMIRSKTIWLDSVANAEELSLSGRKVKLFADLWLTQWAHLEEKNGPKYIGSVIDS